MALRITCPPSPIQPYPPPVWEYRFEPLHLPRGIDEAAEQIQHSAMLLNQLVEEGWELIQMHFGENAWAIAMLRRPVERKESLSDSLPAGKKRWE